MGLTVKDLFDLNIMKNFKLIAGAGGLDRPITRTEILDFEFVQGVGMNRDRIFEGESIAISSLLFAKDNPDMILDTVMRLYELNVSCFAYKPVFINAFLEHMNAEGEARLEDVVQEFARFYEDRIANGLPAEKKKCIFIKGGYTEKDVERLILSMPFKRFEDMNFIHHSKYMGLIQLDRQIVKHLTQEDICSLRQYCDDALERYFGGK